MSSRVIFYEDAIEELYDQAALLLDEYGQRILDAAAPPVDTGFLQASGYLFSASRNTFDTTWPSGPYLSSKRQRLEERQRAPGPEQPAERCATVGWAAIYAYWVDEEQPFIYPALLSVAESGEQSESTGLMRLFA